MKRIFTIIFVFSCAFSFSQEDSFEKEKKNSIGVTYSPLEFIYWKISNYSTSEGPQRLYLVTNSPIGINYQYKFFNSLAVRVGASYGKESILFYETVGLYDISLDYKMQYLRIPFSIRFFPKNIAYDDIEGGLFLEPSGVFDFVIKEDAVRSTSPYWDPRTAPPFAVPAPVVTTTEKHSNEIRFNRICPSLIIGKEYVFKNLNFYFGFRIEFQSVYQKRYTQEFYRNRKLSPMILGLEYRF